MEHFIYLFIFVDDYKNRIEPHIQLNWHIKQLVCEPGAKKEAEIWFEFGYVLLNDIMF